MAKKTVKKTAKKHSTAKKKAASVKKKATIKKKVEIITTSILPAGAANCAVMFVQNLIHEGSIAHQLSKLPGAEGAADWLAKRIISGPHEAVEGLEYELVNLDDGGIQWRITGGTSKWLGYDLSICEEEINRYGPTSFEVESQHNIDADNPDALLSEQDQPWADLTIPGYSE